MGAILSWNENPDLRSDEEHEANARRIVACVNACEGINPEAVPDLLAACELCLEWMDDVCGIQSPYEEVTIKIKDAIAKARGQS